MNHNEIIMSRWLLTIPENLRGEVARFNSRHWQMLSYFARCGQPAAELAANNPALAMMLANNWVFHKPPVQKPLRAVRALLKYKQHKILPWLGFPATRQAVKILRKVVDDCVAISPLLSLRQAMGNPRALALLSHLPRINWAVIGVVSSLDILNHIKPTLLLEVAAGGLEDIFAAFKENFQDILMMGGFLGHDVDCLVFDNLAQVDSKYDCWSRETEEYMCRTMNLPFPPPPIPAIPGAFEPLETLADLVNEARVQKNCLASWAPLIALRKRYYAYRLLRPERATVGLQKAGGVWHIVELKGVRNREVGEETVNYVRELVESDPFGIDCEERAEWHTESCRV